MAPHQALELLGCCEQSQPWDGHRQHLAAVGRPFVPALLSHTQGVLK